MHSRNMEKFVEIICLNVPQTIISGLSDAMSISGYIYRLPATTFSTIVKLGTENIGITVGFFSVYHGTRNTGMEWVIPP